MSCLKVLLDVSLSSDSVRQQVDAAAVIVAFLTNIEVASWERRWDPDACPPLTLLTEERLPESPIRREELTSVNVVFVTTTELAYFVKIFLLHSPVSAGVPVDEPLPPDAPR